MSFYRQDDLNPLITRYLVEYPGVSRSQLIQRVCDEVSTLNHSNPFEPDLFFAVTDALTHQEDQLQLQQQILQCMGSVSPNQDYALLNQEMNPAVLSWQNQMIQSLAPVTTGRSLYEQGMLLYAAGKFEQAYDRFAAAYEQGDRMALFNIGQLLLFGKGRDQNLELAFRCFQECSASGLVIAHFDHGFCYYSGWGVAPDIFQAETYFLNAAACRDYRAQVCLAGIYVEEDLAGLRDYAKAWNYAQAGVQNLERIPQLLAWYHYGLYLLAMILMEGYQNPEQALPYLQHGAEQGSAICQNTLAYTQFHGLGCPVDKASAAYWWGRAVETEQLPEACFHLAGMYLQGDTVQQDYVYGRSLLEIATASQRIPHATYYLALLCRDGLGGKQDLARSQQLLNLSCQQGLPEACAQLAVA